MRITCPPGQLVPDGSLWNDHIRPQELYDGGVKSVIMGLYMGNTVNGKILLNDNCKRICDQLAADGRFIMQAYYYYYPEYDAYRHADWFIDIIRNNGYPFKYAWADLENFRVVMDPRQRNKANKAFADRMHLDYPASGLYTAKWYIDAYCSWQEQINGVWVTKGMNDWIGNYLQWVAHYGRQPALRTMMSWDELKQNWLPNYDITLAPAQVGKTVGHQFTGAHCVLPGFYQKYDYLPWVAYGGRMELDVSVFNAQFLQLIAANQPPVLPPPVPIPIPPPVVVTTNWVVTNWAVHTRSTPDASSEVNLLADMKEGQGIAVDKFSPDGLWAHFTAMPGWTSGGWVYKLYIKQVV